jgi:hypothetical protein
MAVLGRQWRSNEVTVPTVVRRLGVSAAVLFFAATVLQLVGRLDIVFRPPDIPESANLVERLLALIPYRHDIWPIFFGANFLLGVGFVVLVGLAITLASRVQAADARRHLLLWTLGTGGLLGAAGQLVLVGAVQASIDIPYCDCGFKNEELVSQAWAEMVAQSAVVWLIYGASVLAAAGAVIAGQIFQDRGMPRMWSVVSYALAALVVLAVFLGLVGQGDAAEWLNVALAGIVIPGWALWLGVRFDGGNRAEPS